jgi:hypothetical protein
MAAELPGRSVTHLQQKAQPHPAGHTPRASQAIYYTTSYGESQPQSLSVSAGLATPASTQARERQGPAPDETRLLGAKWVPANGETPMPRAGVCRFHSPSREAPAHDGCSGDIARPPRLLIAHRDAGTDFRVGAPLAGSASSPQQTEENAPRLSARSTPFVPYPPIGRTL